MPHNQPQSLSVTLSPRHHAMLQALSRLNVGDGTYKSIAEQAIERYATEFGVGETEVQFVEAKPREIKRRRR
jgi:hypothetical protein